MSVAEARNVRIRSLTDQVGYFDMSNPVHQAHYVALAAEFGELAAIMLVSQDAARVANGARVMGYPASAIEVTAGSRLGLELTDPGQINTHAGWRKLNRVVRHGSGSYYSIIDPQADTKVGGRLIAMFTRDQTVPAYQQPE